MLTSVSIAAAALSTFAACLFGASPTAYWLDSAELVAAAQTLGIAHPPGHPLYVLTCKAATLWPVGAIPFRVGLASALALAVSSSVLTTIYSGCAERGMGWTHPARWPLAAGFAVATCVSYAAAFQGVRAEVYALHLAAISTLVLVVVRFEAAERSDWRWVFLGAATLGAGLANHHLLMALGGAPWLLYVLIRSWRRLRARVVAVAAVAILLMLGIYLTLPIRATANPRVNWGDPSRAARFGWVVSARAFQKSVKVRDDRKVGDNLLTLAGISMEAVTPVGLVLGLFGLGWFIRRRRALGAVLAVSGVLTLVSQLTMPADPHNPDVHGYLLFWIAVLAGGAYCAAAGVMQRLSTAPPRLVPLTAGVLGLALPTAQLGHAAGRWSLRRFHVAERIAEDQLDSLPNSSVLFTSYFQTIFMVWHARVVEGRRPDLTVVHRNFLSYPGYARQVAPPGAELHAVAEEYRKRKRFNVSDLDALAGRRPLFFETDLNLQSDVEARAAPHGWFWAYPTAESQEATRRRQSVFWTHSYRRYRIASRGAETRRYVLWTHFLHAVSARRRGWRKLSLDEARRGLRLSPLSQELKGLLRQ